MSLAALAPSDIKLLKMREYKELAATVGVACYGSKNDIANRIQGAPHGAFKLKTSIDKASSVDLTIASLRLLPLYWDRCPTKKHTLTLYNERLEGGKATRKRRLIIYNLYEKLKTASLSLRPIPALMELA